MPGENSFLYHIQNHFPNLCLNEMSWMFETTKKKPVYKIYLFLSYFGNGNFFKMLNALGLRKLTHLGYIYGI